MEFTKEEVSLCKQVAKKYVKEIHYGVWVAKDKRNTIEVILWNLPIGLTEKQRKGGKWIPLWTISDCLEWLRAKPDLHILELIGDYHRFEWNVVINWKDIYSGKTPLEACLKAILAVLEEKSE